MGYLVPPYTGLDLVLGSGTPVSKILVRALGRSSGYYFKVLNLFYSLLRGPNGFITEKTILFQGSRGGPSFSRVSNFFQGGGPNANFYRNPSNLCFSRGGVRIPPQDPHIRISG